LGTIPQVLESRDLRDVEREVSHTTERLVWR